MIHKINPNGRPRNGHSPTVKLPRLGSDGCGTSRTARKSGGPRELRHAIAAFGLNCEPLGNHFVVQGNGTFPLLVTDPSATRHVAHGGTALGLVPHSKALRAGGARRVWLSLFLYFREMELGAGNLPRYQILYAPILPSTSSAMRSAWALIWAASRPSMRRRILGSVPL